MSNHIIQFDKDHAAIKNYLLGRGYKKALQALAFARKHHTGMRKDGLTPEFHHQIRIAFSIMNLRDVVNEELCLILAFLHDTPEDNKHVTYAVLERLFGEEVATKACILDKGNYESDVAYFTAVENDIDCSIVKGADNLDNIQSMLGVFNKEKMGTYMERTKTQILPMLKNASNNFPEQSFSYSGLRVHLKNQLALYAAICV